MRNWVLELIFKGVARAVHVVPYHPWMRFLPRLFIKFQRVDLASELMHFVIEALLRSNHTFKKPVIRHRVTQRTHKIEALQDVVSFFKSHLITPFLAYGTLLGWAREGHFLAQDHDVDLGAFWAPTLPIETLIQDALAQGFQVIKVPITGKNSTFKLRHPNGISVDIVLFKVYPDGSLGNYNRLYGRSFERKRSGFGVKPATFEGVAVDVPDPPELFLDEFYGPWREPVGAFYSPYISTPLKDDFSDPAYQYLARSTVFFCLFTQNKPALMTCLQHIRRKDSSLYWGQLQEKIEAGA